MCYAPGVERDWNIHWGRMEGKEVKRLMRVHKVTIRELSARMQITQKRIRQIRESGLENPNVIRDWLQGILGHDPGPV